MQDHFLSTKILNKLLYNNFPCTVYMYKKCCPQWPTFRRCTLLNRHMCQPWSHRSRCYSSYRLNHNLRQRFPRHMAGYKSHPVQEIWYNGLHGYLIGISNKTTLYRKIFFLVCECHCLWNKYIMCLKLHLLRWSQYIETNSTDFTSINLWTVYEQLFSLRHKTRVNNLKLFFVQYRNFLPSNRACRNTFRSPCYIRPHSDIYI